jgi:hypothetical protein
MAQCHRTTWSHSPQRHVRGCGTLPPMCVNVSVPRNEWTAYPILLLSLPGRVSSQPEHKHTEDSLACTLLRFWKATADTGKRGGCSIGWHMEGASRLASAAADVSARDASASPPALVAFSPNGDVRVNTVVCNNSEAMSLLEALPMREAPIVRREHAIAARYYADRDTVSSCPGLPACLLPPRPERVFVAACCTMYLLSRSPVTFVRPRMILCHVLGWTASYPRASWKPGTSTNNIPVVEHIQPCTSHAVLAGCSLPTSSAFSIKRSSAARLFGTPPPHVSSLRDLFTLRPLHKAQTSLPFFHPRAVALGRTARTPRRRFGIDGQAALTEVFAMDKHNNSRYRPLSTAGNRSLAVQISDRS